MKKRILSLAMALALCLTLLPAAALAEGTEQTEQTPPTVGEPADPANGKAEQEQENQQEDSAVKQDEAVATVQAMIDALPEAETIGEDNAADVEARLDAIDEAKAELSDAEIDGLDMTRYMETAAALELLLYGTAAPSDAVMLANGTYKEQFSTLSPGEIYWFDLSREDIPGTKNASLPDKTLHWVPFTYAGTVKTYVLNKKASAGAVDASQKPLDTSLQASLTEDPSGTYGYTYHHSLFIADYAVTHTVTWNELNSKDMIFGKAYPSDGVDYSLRAPTVGSQARYDAVDGFGGDYGSPILNEWDEILDKSDSYIKNWKTMYSWGQDTYFSYRGIRGVKSAPYWYYHFSDEQPLWYIGFRPVLEVKNADTLGAEGLRVVTLDLNGGKIGSTEGTANIVVKSGDSFTAPGSEGLTRPAGNGGAYFRWLGSDGRLYSPADEVPAAVTTLTAQWTSPAVHFDPLTPGETYWFDLFGEDIPGTKNTSLPDESLHWVPFTYAGTVNAYKMVNETDHYAHANAYDHSLFIADYTLTHTVSWKELNGKDMIFGKNYASSGVDYSLRAPSVGTSYDSKSGSGENERCTPESNEWDAILNKSGSYIKDLTVIASWGQDKSGGSPRYRGKCDSNYNVVWYDPADIFPDRGFRPVLEVQNADTLGADGLRVAELDLNGGKIGSTEGTVNIVVKSGGGFTAPDIARLTRPDKYANDSFFKWLGSDGTSYAPGAAVPEGVPTLAARWTDFRTVKLYANSGTIDSGNIVSYNLGEETALPTAGDMTRKGYTFGGWYDNENLTGTPVTVIGSNETENKEYWAKWTINSYTVTYALDGGAAEGNPSSYNIDTDTFTLKNPTRPGYTFTGWSGTDLTGESNMTVTVEKGSIGDRSYTAHWRYNGGGSSGGSSSGGGSTSSGSGTVTTETTKNNDGSTTKTETKKDGTVIATTTAKDGSVTRIETKPNGNSVTETKAADGSTGTVKTDKNGNTEAETKVSAKAVEDAKKNGEAVKAPVEVKASRNSNTAPTVKVELPKGTGETKVEIPVSNVKPGTVAVLVHPDGTEEIAKNSLPTEDGIQLTVNGGATVKIVDNSKDFIDTRNHWAKDAIDFVSARGLVNGMSATIYAPNASTTRAQLWTILARQDGADLTGGATWFENAQNWAKAKGISDGANPDGTINRAQMVTMLWRAMGQPTAASGVSFADVPADSYYAQAVAWAIENGITDGVGGGHFDPNSTCTRAQIATFLYRLYLSR